VRPPGALGLAAAAAAAVAAAGAARADTLDLGGAVGGSFEHSDVASSTREQGIPSWGWTGNLSLGWAPVRPELLALGGTAAYGSSRWSNYGLRRSDTWTWRGSSTLLGGFPLSLQLDAGRSWAGSTGRLGSLGETLATTESAGARLAIPGYPRLTASLSRSRLETEVLGGSSRTTRSQRVTAGASHTTPGLSFSVDYGGSSSDSASVAESNYGFHGLNVAASARLSDGADLRFNQSYTLRLPTVRDSRNPRLDQNLLGTGVALRPGPGTSVNLDYGYQHALVDAPGFSVESTSHGVTLAGTQRWSDAWASDASAQLSHAEVRNALVTSVSDGQSLGAGASWTAHPAPRLRTMLTGRGSVGAIQRVGRGEVSWGGSAGANASFEVGASRAAVSYSGTVQRNDATLDGEEIAHRVAIEGRAVRGAGRLSLTIQGAASTRTDELVGSSSSRSMTLTADAARGRTTVTLAGGVAYGVTGREGYDISPGLYVLPYELDADTRHLSLSAAGLRGGVEWALRATTARVALSGEPSEYRHGLEATASYRLGRFQLQLADRFVAARRGAAWSRGNTVMLRLLRSFSLAL
jgi:hypothetical protein